MISSFWNLCRTCPSVPVEKLHSEYRSTFQWHEYVGANRAHGITQRHHNHAVVTQPSTSTIAQPNAFWSGSGQREEEHRGGKRVNITNINNSANGWWLRVESSKDQIRPQIQAQAQSRGHSHLESQLPSEEGPKKSLSLGTIRGAFENIPVQTHQPTQSAHAEISATEVEQRKDMDNSKGSDSLEWTETRGLSSSFEGARGSDEPARRRKEYKSEYKKQFRPFSQYEYVDGRFFKKKNEQDVNPWYKEVIELRQKAGEYRYRGWGTELVPQHLAEHYHQSVWDQVSKRSSLAALALITTTTQKSITKEEKDKENVRKSMPKRSHSRPNTATPKHPISDFKKDSSDAVHGAKKKYEGPPSVSGRPSRGKARSQSAGPGGRSPRKSYQVIPKEREVLEKPLPRHPRPTTLATSPRPKASSDKGHRDVNSKLVKTLQFDKSSADPSLGFSEPVIKSPPEPTRVKSPEQVILKSPDPVNWTVPLDTTKSFTVTQNIRDAPPSPRFRAGEGRSSSSGQHASGTISSKGSSPLSSSFSPRSGVSQTQRVAGQSQRPPPGKLTRDDHQPPHRQPKTVLPPGSRDKKPDFNLNGENQKRSSGTTIQQPQKLDNRKPDDTTNNNDKKPLTAGPIKDNKYKTETPKPINNPSLGKKPLPGATLLCLEDPQFMFDPPKNSQTKPSSVPIVPTVHSNVPSSTSAVTSPPKPLVPQPAPRGIRVLDAPMSPPSDFAFVPPAPVAVSSSKIPGVGVSDSLPTKPQGAKLPAYKVLDAPEPPIIPPPGQASSSSGGKEKGSHVFEKAKHKFDKLWGKSSKDSEK